MPSTPPHAASAHCIKGVNQGSEPGHWLPVRGHREPWRTGLDWPPHRCGLQSWGHNYAKAGSCLTSGSLFPSEKWEPSTQSRTRFAFVEGWVGAATVDSVHCAEWT